MRVVRGERGDAGAGRIDVDAGGDVAVVAKTGFCANRAITLCDDFEGAIPAEKWNKGKHTNFGGTITHERDPDRDSQVLQVTMPAGGQEDAASQLLHEVRIKATKISLELDVQVVKTKMKSTQLFAVFDFYTTPPTTVRVGYDTGRLHVASIEGQYQEATGDFPIGKWVHLTIAIDWSDKLHIDLTKETTVVLSKDVPLPTNRENHVRLELGVYSHPFPTEEDTALRYDNVLYNVE